MKRSAGVSIQDRSRLFVKTEEKVTQQFKVKCTSILVRVCRGWGGGGFPLRGQAPTGQRKQPGTPWEESIFSVRLLGESAEASATDVLLGSRERSLSRIGCQSSQVFPEIPLVGPPVRTGVPL